MFFSGSRSGEDEWELGGTGWDRLGLVTVLGSDFSRPGEDGCGGEVVGGTGLVTVLEAA